MVKNSATFRRSDQKSKPVQIKDPNQKFNQESSLMKSSVKGSLYIVAMPIGNREDITLRAISILKSVDVILAEDTRHSLPLLTSLMIQKPLLSYHAHNEEKRNDSIIESLQEGRSFALISDAGTPLISDPGFSLVRLAREKDIPVIPIPGACALITALSAAGVPCNEFTFIGFLPPKTKFRKERLKNFLNHKNTIIFYESSHRIIDCVEDIIEVFGNTYEFVLAKELTKLHEHFISGIGEHILSWLKNDNHTKGEFVLILSNVKTSTEEENSQEETDEQILNVLLNELPLKQAVSIACQLTKRNKNSLYQLALRNTQKQKGNYKEKELDPPPE